MRRGKCYRIRPLSSYQKTAIGVRCRVSEIARHGLVEGARFPGGQAETVLGLRSLIRAGSPRGSGIEKGVHGEPGRMGLPVRAAADARFRCPWLGTAMGRGLPCAASAG